jgi:hypothetical protein
MSPYRPRFNTLIWVGGKRSTAVDGMSANIDAPNGASLQIENGAKVGLDPYGIDVLP